MDTNSAKLEAMIKYKQERELCKNTDMTPYECTHTEIMAYMNGWDAAVKWMLANAE